MITPLCRFTYANVFEPKANLSGALKYSTGLLFPKTDTKAIAAVTKAIDDAIQAGVKKGTFNAAASKSRTFKHPLRDGDEYYATADESQRANRECYRGMMFLNASNQNPIGVVDAHARPIINQEDFYSGCWGHADINFSAFNKGGSIGVGCYVNNVMKKKDDDRFDGRQSAEAAFVGYTDSDDSDDSDGSDGSDLQ